MNFGGNLEFPNSWYIDRQNTPEIYHSIERLGRINTRRVILPHRLILFTRNL
jgi:hypothetical protein